MKCSNCGYELIKLTNFCPACGEKLSEDQKSQLTHPVPPSRKLKVFLGVILSALLITTVFILLSSDMTDTVKEQLKEIKAGRLSEAYQNYTSKSFQAATPFESFEEFMKTYPALAKNASVRFIDRTENDNSGELHALVETSEGNEVPVFFKLVYEGDKWRVLSMKVEKPQQNQVEAKSDVNKTTARIVTGGGGDDFDVKPLKQVISDQLAAIRSGDIRKAYDQYTSKDFKKFSPFTEFEGFVKGQTGYFDNTSVDIGDLEFDNNIATFQVVLGAPSGKKVKVGYDLVFEDNAWKVVHLDVIEDRMVANDEARGKNLDKPIEFKKFVIGTSSDKDGLITIVNDNLQVNSGEIFLNVYVNNAKKGTKVEVVLEHLDTDSKIDPIYIDVNEDGESILSFSFFPPREGWPTGNYRFLVTASTGESTSYDFKIL